jgi:hypothetical protein
MHGCDAVNCGTLQLANSQVAEDWPFGRLRAGKRTVKRGRTGSHQLRAAGSRIAAITVMRSVAMESPRTLITLYRCRWNNPLIAAGAEELEPEDRGSGAPCPASGLP